MNATFMAFFSALMNLVCSVGIIVTNRWIFQFYNFNFSVMLSVVHLIVTFLGLRFCAVLGLFERAPNPTLRNCTDKKLYMLSFIHGISVPFANLALQLCSVGLYQIMKIVITPTIVLVSWGFFGGKCPSLPITLCILVILIGAGITTSAEISASPMGVISALIMSISSAICQVWMNDFQAENKINAVQLLTELAPLSAIVCGFCGFWVEDFNSLISFEYTPKLEVALVISCTLALLYNVSFFIFVGATSALTYQVLGHMKTGLVLLFGFLVFGSPLSQDRALGIFVTLTGVIAYSVFKHQESTQPPSTLQPPPPSPTAIEVGKNTDTR